jgi:hypothetical protein
VIRAEGRHDRLDGDGGQRESHEDAESQPDARPPPTPGRVGAVWTTTVALSVGGVDDGGLLPTLLSATLAACLTGASA